MSENLKAKAYELRDFTADDVFPMFCIIDKIGVKEFKACFDSPDVRKAIGNVASGKAGKADNAALASVGMAVAFDIATVVVANLPKAKDDIYLFLSQLSGMTKEEIAGLPMLTFMQMIVDVIKKEEFKDFFGVVAGLFK